MRADRGACRREVRGNSNDVATYLLAVLALRVPSATSLCRQDARRSNAIGDPLLMMLPAKIPAPHLVHHFEGT